jgi:hypothetical protein
MLRRVFTAASGLSLLMGIAAAMLWIRSYWYWDDLSFGRSPRCWISYHATNWNRQFRFVRIMDDCGPADVPRHVLWEAAPYPDGWRARPDNTAWDWGGTCLGFTAGQVTCKPPIGDVLTGRAFSGTSFVVGVPPWFASTIWLILPLCWSVGRYARRAPSGYCRACGYDLRASQDRCPECGMPIPTNRGTSA